MQLFMSTGKSRALQNEVPNVECTGILKYRIQALHLKPIAAFCRASVIRFPRAGGGEYYLSYRVAEQHLPKLHQHKIAVHYAHGANPQFITAFDINSICGRSQCRHSVNGWHGAVPGGTVKVTVLSTDAESSEVEIDVRTESAVACEDRAGACPITAVATTSSTTMTTTAGKVPITPECLCGQDVFFPMNRPRGWASCKTVLYTDRICEKPESSQEHARKACCLAETTSTTTGKAAITTTATNSPTVVFRMKGKSGQEKIIVTVDEDETVHTLTTSFELFHIHWPKSGAYYVTFANDAPGQDVYFDAVNPVISSLEHTTNWQRWGCGSGKENIRCNSVRSGTFAWSGRYKITPQATVAFRMKGKSGEEQITVTVDEDVTAHTLTTSFELFHIHWPNTGAYYVTFANDAPGRDVYFEAVDPVISSLEHMTNWQRWECGSGKENARCNSVRSGTFAWNGRYKITPQAATMEVECTDCDECAWNGSDSQGQKSLGGGGHSVNDCMRACLSAPSCRYAARSSSGYCHHFETCTPGSGTGWTRWRKTVKGGDEGQTSVLELQPPKKGLSGPAAKSIPETRQSDDVPSEQALSRASPIAVESWVMLILTLCSFCQ